MRQFGGELLLCPGLGDLSHPPGPLPSPQRGGKGMPAADAVLSGVEGRAGVGRGQSLTARAAFLGAAGCEPALPN